MSHILMTKMNWSCIFPKPITPIAQNQDFRDTLRQAVCCFGCECLYLLALYIPAGSCGQGHLASLTAMRCICFRMGTQGKFPAGISCVVLWSFIALTEFHIRKVLLRETRLYIVAVLHMTVSLFSWSCFPSWEKYHRWRLCVLFRVHNMALNDMYWMRL